MSFFYQCSECGKKFEIKPSLMVCPVCSKKQEKDKPLRGILEVKSDDKLSENFSFYDFLPIEKDFFPPVPVGNTPLWKPQRINRKYGFQNLFLKDDTRNLTYSYKDRASLLVAAFALKHNIREIAVASTGNAASSMAGIGASCSLDVTIFMPKSAPKAKMIQSLQYGARVIACAGTYDDAFSESMAYTQQNPHVLSRNTAYNPLTIDGKKTAAIEIFQQLQKAPDYVFVPTGDGVILSGIYKGFKDLLENSFIDSIPTIIAVQAKGSNAICRAFASGDFNHLEAETVADSISVNTPAAGYYALKHLKDFRGKCITVSDDEILQAQKELSSQSGLFAEPAASASYAGFLKLKENLEKNANIVLLITGSGLKDIQAGTKLVSLGL